ncbi:Uncharacterized protein Rs2_44684 [Raphanus sativus]|nr:Uncharacterized protein Rs2_44684 [Raphanus sativus]
MLIALSFALESQDRLLSLINQLFQRRNLPEIVLHPLPSVELVLPDLHLKLGLVVLQPLHHAHRLVSGRGSRVPLFLELVAEVLDRLLLARDGLAEQFAFVLDVDFGIGGLVVISL